jgi:ferrous iron transport protein A
MGEAFMTLDELARGQEAIVKNVTADGSLGQRLMDLGFYPGAEVSVVRNAPLEDPVELRLEGSGVSLRHAEARHIEVLPR